MRYEVILSPSIFIHVAIFGRTERLFYWQIRRERNVIRNKQYDFSEPQKD